jgi:hypothetical protein
MSKTLQTLIERAAKWPEEARDEAARALAAIEQKHLGGDLEEIRTKIAASLADARPDVSVDDAFGRIERLHAERMKPRGDAA